jgi:hypothetical protein
MIPFAQIVNRWTAYSVAPMYVGAIPEGLFPPYAALNVVQSNQVTLSGNAILWTESLLQLSVAHTTLANCESLADQAIQTYDRKQFAGVADMTLLNRATSYSEQPNLTGNRIWTATLEFRVRH